MLQRILIYLGLITMVFIADNENLFAQPYVDISNFNTQVFQSSYKDSIKAKNKTTDYLLSVFFPKQFKNDNSFLLRLSAEKLHSEYRSDTTYSHNLYALSMPVGMQLVSKNKKWKSLFMVIPKISSDFKDNLRNDYQVGGTLLFTYVQSETLKLKAGLYYNKEYFGNYFVPLVGIDWKASSHLSLYGILPSNFRIEYRLGNKFFTGIGYKSFQRSYRLSAKLSNNFVRARETQIKLFTDYFVYKKILLFADVAHTIGYSIIQYRDKKTKSENNPIYSPFKNNFLFTVGLAYRLRLD